MAAIPAVDGGYSQQSVAAEPVAPAPEPIAAAPAPAPEPLPEPEPEPIYEPPLIVEEHPQPTEFKFDENDMDPLKKVVEANRNS